MVPVVIEKCPIPIIWIDTSVITNMTIARTSPRQLEKSLYERVQNLYTQVKEASRKGQVICPLSSQEQEVWINRNDWLDTIHDLGLGITCSCRKNIQDAQLHAAMKAYSSQSKKINLSYRDMFDSDPVKEVNSILGEPVFVTVRQGVFQGADYQRSKKEELIKSLNMQRIRNVQNKVKFPEQLKKERIGDLEALLISLNEISKGIESSEDGINNFFGYSELMDQTKAWNYYSGKNEDLPGLIEFYKSEYNNSIPYTNLSAHMYAKIMVDPQEIKSGDPMDIEHASGMLPYVDLYITDKHWRTFLNQKKFGDIYGTKVCYISDDEKIQKFFSEL